MTTTQQANRLPDASARGANQPVRRCNRQQGVSQTQSRPDSLVSRDRPRPAVRRALGQWSRLTPREMTSTDSSNAEIDSTPISSFARGDSGMVSVGLKADELVIDTYR